MVDPVIRCAVPVCVKCSNFPSLVIRSWCEKDEAGPLAFERSTIDWARMTSGRTQAHSV